MDDFIFADNISIPEAEFEAKVPADLRGYYAKGEGGVYAVPEAHASTTKLLDGLRTNLKTKTNTLTATQQEAKTRREALEAIYGTVGIKDAAEFKTKWDELQAKIASGTKDKINPDEIRAAIMADITPQLTAKDAELEAMTKSLSEHLIDGDAARALAEAKGNVTVLMPHIKSQSKVIKNDEGKYVAVVTKPDGTPRVGADGGYVPVSKLVEELKANKDFAGNFAGNQNNGPGNQQQNHQQQNRQQVQQPQNGQRELRGVAKIAAATAQR